MLRTTLLALVLPAVLAACGGSRSADIAGFQTLKSACVGGNYQSCSDIGHMSRTAMGGVNQPPAAALLPLSQPIID